MNVYTHMHIWNDHPSPSETMPRCFQMLRCSCLMGPWVKRVQLMKVS